MRFEDRYERVGPLGAGGYGQVFRARDALRDGREVALKKIPFSNRDELAEIYKEIAILRALSLPGVVRFLDQGEVDGHAYVVTELIEGRPFLEGLDTWAEMAPQVMRLLTILDQIHAVGLVHRDLKPANILVDAEGRPTLLDFGVAIALNDAQALRQSGSGAGTPAYLAPEQLEPPISVSPATDLYSLGVLLFERLSGGQLPFEGDNVQAQFFARLFREPLDLRDFNPDAPPSVIRLIDALLQRIPAHRPQSALEVIERLKHGRAVAQDPTPTLPLLGRDADLARLLEAARARRSVRLEGPPGVGKTRLLGALVDALKVEGIEARTPPKRRIPFGSLGSFARTIESRDDLSLDEAFREVVGRLRAYLKEGGVIIVDDGADLDAYSQRALCAACTSGALISVGLGCGEPLQLVDLEVEDLKALFTGFERLYHTPTDAARVLFQSTNGRPRRIHDELEAWVRAGLAVRRGRRFTLAPSVLAQLRSGARLTNLRRLPIGVDLDVEEARHLTLLSWCWPHTHPDTLAPLVEGPRWRLEATLEGMEARGLVERLPDGRYLALAKSDAPLAGFDSRQAFHRRFADQLPERSLERFHHALLSQTPYNALWVALGVIEDALDNVAFERAQGVLEQALPLLSELKPTPLARGLVKRLLTLSARQALAVGTSHALSQALYTQVRFADPPDPELERLLKLSLEAPESRSEAALEGLRALPPFEDLHLAVWRHIRMMRAAWNLDAQEEACTLALIEGEVARRPELDRPYLNILRGRALYRQERYEDALERFEDALAGAHPGALLKALLGRASVALELGRWALCQESARRALALLTSLQEPYHEAYATYYLRASLYRAGEWTPTDEALLEAVAHLNPGYLEGMILLMEAATAWRLGALERARVWAAKAARIWRGLDSRGPLPLAEALTFALGGEGAPGALIERGVAHPSPLIGIQVIGLVCARIGHPERAALIEARLEGLDVDRGRRQELLSVDEALTLSL